MVFDDARRRHAHRARHVGIVEALAEIILIERAIGRARLARDLGKGLGIGLRRNQLARRKARIFAGRRRGALGHPVHQRREDRAIGVRRGIGIGQKHAGIHRRRDQIEAATAAIMVCPGIVIAPHIGGQRNVGLCVGADIIGAGAQVPEFRRAHDLGHFGTAIVRAAAIQQALAALAARRVVIVAPPIDAVIAHFIESHQSARRGEAVAHGVHPHRHDGIEAVEHDAAVLGGVESQIDQARR